MRRDVTSHLLPLLQFIVVPESFAIDVSAIIDDWSAFASSARLCALGLVSTKRERMGDRRGHTDRQPKSNRARASGTVAELAMDP